MNNNFEQVKKRTRQYWFSDGFVEIINGAIFLLLGAYFYLQFSLPDGSIWLFLLQAGFVILLIGSIFLGRRVVNTLKIRFTYPRTGYIGFQPASKQNRWIAAGVALFMAILLVVLFNATPVSLNWLPAITGFVVAAFWLVSAARVGLLRFYILAVGSMLIGTGLSFANFEVLIGTAAYYSAMGALLMGSGGLTLTRYMRQSSDLEDNLTPRVNN